MATEAKANFPYEGRTENETSVAAGDIVKVLSKHGEWWFVEPPRGGKRGMVPGSYLTELPRTVSVPNLKIAATAGVAATPTSAAGGAAPPAQQQPATGTAGVAAQIVDGKTYARAARTVQAKPASGALSFVENDVIIVHEQYPTGICRGELNGRFGTIPRDYIVFISADEARALVRAAAAAAAVGASPVVATTAAAAATSASASASASAATTALAAATTAASATLVAGAPACKFRARAGYDYGGKSASELSVKAGEEVSVLEDTIPGGWWLCELRGSIGHLPASYMQKLKAQPPQPQQQQPISAPASVQAAASSASTSAGSSKPAPPQQAKAASVSAAATPAAPAAATQTQAQAQPPAPAQTQPAAAAAAAATAAVTPAAAVAQPKSTKPPKPAAPRTRTSSISMRPPCKAKVIYDRVGASETELTVKEGDIIALLSIDPSGWCTAEAQGRKGIIPKDWLAAIPDDAPVAAAVKPAAAVATATATAAAVTPVTAVAAPAAEPAKVVQPAEPPKQHAKVLFDFKPTEEGQLEVKSGDEVIVVAHQGLGWALVELKGRIGHVPQSWLQNIATPESVVAPAAAAAVASSPAAAAEAKAASVSASVEDIPPPTEVKEEQPAPAAAAQEPAAVKVAENEAVRAEPPQQLHEEAVAAQQARPEESAAQEQPTTAAVAEEKLPEEKAVALFEFSSKEEGQLSLSIGDIVAVLEKPEGPWWKGSVGTNVGFFPQAYVQVLKDPKDCPRAFALHDFNGTDKTQLSFTKESVLVVLQQEEGDWWRGELNGHYGLFPKAYVRLMSAEEAAAALTSKKDRQEKPTADIVVRAIAQEEPFQQEAKPAEEEKKKPEPEPAKAEEPVPEPAKPAEELAPEPAKSTEEHKQIEAAPVTEPDPTPAQVSEPAPAAEAKQELVNAAEIRTEPVPEPAAVEVRPEPIPEPIPEPAAAPEVQQESVVAPAKQEPAAPAAVEVKPEAAPEAKSESAEAKPEPEPEPQKQEAKVEAAAAPAKVEESAKTVPVVSSIPMAEPEPEVVTSWDVAVSASLSSPGTLSEEAPSRHAAEIATEPALSPRGRTVSAAVPTSASALPSAGAARAQDEPPKRAKTPEGERRLHRERDRAGRPLPPHPSLSRGTSRTYDGAETVVAQMAEQIRQLTARVQALEEGGSGSGSGSGSGGESTTPRGTEARVSELQRRLAQEMQSRRDLEALVVRLQADVEMLVRAAKAQQQQTTEIPFRQGLRKTGINLAQ